MKSYNQYCPIAHALDVVGERWALLIVRELIEHDQLRYSDLHTNLSGCGTNSLAARLKDLERNGVVRRRRLPPPAASTVYELTEYGRELQPVMHMLAHWGARSLGPPGADDLVDPGWLPGALEMAFPQHPTDAPVEFRVGDEVASFLDGEPRPGPVENPALVVECDRAGFYHLLVDRDLTRVSVEGDEELLRSLIDALPYAERATATAVGPAA
ncbi:MAG: helix-turn-helix transcriptional regulator [Actinobacteria bacterium]|nr:helix-turn-helix transcriptional regulator [Actinomycetota bacterium]